MTFADKILKAAIGIGIVTKIGLERIISKLVEIGGENQPGVEQKINEVVDELFKLVQEGKIKGADLITKAKFLFEDKGLKLKSDALGEINELAAALEKATRKPEEPKPEEPTRVSKKMAASAAKRAARANEPTEKPAAGSKKPKAAGR
jgi:hypothetical protein